jgi:hypothetical protein
MIALPAATPNANRVDAGDTHTPTRELPVVSKQTPLHQRMINQRRRGGETPQQPRKPAVAGKGGGVRRRDKGFKLSIT